MIGDNDREFLRRLGVPEGIGATGEYPEGRAAPDDRGEIKVALATDRAAGRLILAFGEPVSWIGMTAGEAIGFAHVLLRQAKELSR